MKKVRTRFAPSPTGSFHIGNARTALFNYIFAKQNKGTFIIRIEDTDLERSKPEFEKDILEGLKWLGLDWTEGPYKQSERSHKKYIEKLLKENKAYHCFCSQEELDIKRQDQMARGAAPKYDGKCSSLTKEEVKDNLKQGKKSVIRLRVANKKVSFNDLIRGHVETDSALIGDFVIARSLDNPLFYLAGAIDDEEMKITHVIRGEDHISNTPKQILIQEALDFAKPSYAHLPLILATDRSKLSKRHGAVAVTEYREQGYLPETLINFLAFLGWNPGDDKEMYSLEELVKDFSLEQVQKGGAIFDQKRLDFLNGFYIRQKPLKELAKLCEPYLGVVSEKVVGVYQTRLKKLSDIKELADFYFKDELEYPKQLLKWQDMSDKELIKSLDKAEEILSNINEKNWNQKNLQEVLLSQAQQFSNRGCLLWPLRVALSGKEFSAGPFELAEILGKEKTLKRIKEAKSL